MPRRDHRIDAGPTADSTATTDETITVALGWTDLTLDGVDLPDDDPPAPATVDEPADPTDGAFDVRLES